jgi:hypothetical protein
MDGIKIACPKCQWQPDGQPHWKCRCGYRWNTFETKWKCPECGIQWQDTYCPGCGKSSVHDEWYTTYVIREEQPPANIIELKIRKDKVESKLISYGLKDSKITYLPYLDFSPEEFQTPYEVGCRILILWAVSYVAANLNEKYEIANWLKICGLWDRVSEEEKKLFTEDLSERALMDFSWHLEAVVVLCWAVNLLEVLPDLNTQISDSAVDGLMAKLPICENPEIFLSILEYRDKEEIFIENIINEMITWYLRDRMLNKKENESNVNSTISFERHYALNWVRKFSEISEWDETDTST